MFDRANTDPYDPDSGEKPEPWQLFAPAGDEAGDPGQIASRLIATDENFARLRELEPSVLFLWRAVPKAKGGKIKLGEMVLVRALRGGTAIDVLTWLLGSACHGLPDYLMVLDAGWWGDASPMQREALIWHELEHATQACDQHGEPRFSFDGKPVWDLRAHDVEEFDSVVRRYGAWLPDVHGFAAALRDGGAV